MKLIYILRSFFASIYFLIATVVFGSTLIVALAVIQSDWLPKKLAVKVRKYKTKIVDFISWIWGRTIQVAFNMRVQVKGEENIPEGGCLFLFNHTSHFDILTIYGQLKKSARFGAKIELFKIPLFGQVLRSGGMLPIARADREDVLKLYQDSIGRVRAGESFLLAAEGTRQPSPGVGAKFKSGPFIFAISGQFPIVPVVLKGSTECLPKGQLLACTQRWRYDISLRFLPPVSTSGLTLNDRKWLQEDVREMMARAYEADKIEGP